MSSKDADATDNRQVQVLSICQHITNMCSQKLCTLKGLELGLALKHATGSKEVIALLNRLGHCAYDFILGYEPSLANYTMSERQSIPNILD